MSAARLGICDVKQVRKNTLRGFFTLEFPSGLRIHDYTWHESQGGRSISFPGKPFTKADGTQGWANIIELPHDKMARLRDAVLELIDQQVGDMPDTLADALGAAGAALGDLRAAAAASLNHPTDEEAYADMRTACWRLMHAAEAVVRVVDQVASPSPE